MNHLVKKVVKRAKQKQEHQRQVYTSARIKQGITQGDMDCVATSIDPEHSHYDTQNRTISDQISYLDAIAHHEFDASRDRQTSAYMIQRYDILTRERIKKGFHNTIEQELDAIS
jgi:hypothetical protein